MANIKVIVTAVNKDSPEIAIGLNTGPTGVWIAHEHDIEKAGTVTGSGTATPGTDWVTWYLEGDAGAKFKVECFVDDATQWVTERVVQIGHSFTADSKGI
jgi:hypothetical protein